MLVRKESLFAAIEGSYGVDATPDADDAIQLASVIQPNAAEQARFAERTVQRGSLGALRPLFGGSLFSIQFSVELKPSGEAGVPPEWGRLMRACRFNETIVALESVAYHASSADADDDSLTMYYFQDGIRYRLLGCRGAVNMSATVGQVPMLEFRFVGRLHASDPTDQAAFASPVYDDTTPPVFMGDDFFSIGAFNAAFSEFSIDWQNQVVAPPNANSSDGYGQVVINGRDVRGSIDPEMTLVATQDWIGDFKSSTQRAITWQIGTVGGNRVGLSVPLASYIEPAFAERDGKRTQTIGFKADESAALDDEATLTLD